MLGQHPAFSKENQQVVLGRNTGIRTDVWRERKERDKLAISLWQVS